jgi:hypothetical protein
MAALYLMQPFAARAADEVVMDDGGDVIAARSSGHDMPASNPRVKSILAAHPDQYVVVCVAGCDGKPKAVQILPRPVMGRQGAFVPAKGKMERKVYGPPAPGQSAAAAAAKRDDVVCVAGCLGRPGQVLQHVSDLPAPVKVKPGTRKRSILR